MRVKRIFAMILAFMLVFSILPATVFAEEVGTYTVKHTIQITGTGKVTSTLYNDEKTFEHTGSGTASYTHTVTVPADKPCRYQMTAISNEVYGFAGWYKNGKLEHSMMDYFNMQPGYAVSSPEAGQTYEVPTHEAKFVERRYSVKIHFVAEEGGLVSPELYEQQNIPADRWESFSSTATPDKHHDFAGWYYNGNLFSEDETMTDKVNSTYLYDLIERTYTAKFTPKSYGIAFVDPDNGHIFAVGEYLYGTPVSEIYVPEPYEKEGLAFVGWKDMETGFWLQDVIGSATYVAQYTDQYYTVSASFNTEGNGSVTPASFSKRIPVGQSVSFSSTATPDEGNNFLGWYKNGQLYTKDATMTDSFSSSILHEVLSTTYTAKFEPIKYAVTVNSGSGSGNYAAGSDVDIEANAAETGMRFKEWEGAGGLTFVLGDANSSKATFKMPAGEVTLTATYEVIPPSYIVTVNGGSGSGSYEEGQEVSIKANVSEGMRFLKWEAPEDLVFTQGSVTSEEATFKMPAKVVEITAVCEEIPSHNVTVTGGTGTGEYKEGALVSIKADTPEFGKIFKEWSGAEELEFTQGSASSEEATFKMPTKDVELIATYENIVSDWATLKAELEAGRSVKLFCDITRDAAENIYVQGTVSLDLNGHTIYGYENNEDTWAGYSILVVEDGDTLTVTDSSTEKTGCIINVWGTDVISVYGTDADNYGSFVLASGTVGGPSTAVYVGGYGHFMMTGGSINTGGGSGVSIDSFGVFTMQGGSIKGNLEGVVITFPSASFNVSGDVDITGNTDKDISLFRLEGGKFNPIHIEGPLAETARIGIYAEGDADDFTAYESEEENEDIVFTDGLKDNGNIDNFVSNREDLAFGVSENGELAIRKGYKLTVSGGSGSGLYYKGEEVTIKADDPAEGMRFKEWEGEDIDDVSFVASDKYSSEATIKMPGSELTLTATYEEIPPTYKLTVENGFGGGDYEEGTVITIKADDPAEGMRFKEWAGADGVEFTKGDRTSSEATIKMPAHAVTLTATYEEIPVTVYKVTVTNDGNGTASADKAEGPSGTEVTLTATPKTGYKLKEWQVVKGGVSVRDNKFTIGTEDVEIKAVFEAVSDSGNGDGNGTGNGDTGSGNGGSNGSGSDTGTGTGTDVGSGNGTGSGSGDGGNDGAAENGVTTIGAVDGNGSGNAPEGSGSESSEGSASITSAEVNDGENTKSHAKLWIGLSALAVLIIACALILMKRKQGK